MQNSNYIAYRHGHELKVGKVIRDQKGKLLVADQGGRTESVKADAVVVRFPAISAPDNVEELAQRIEREAQSIDAELLWEIFVDSAGEFDAERAADEFFGGASPLQTAAASKALLDDQLHFRRKGRFFLPRPRSEVDDLKHRERREAERAALQERAIVFLKQVLSGVQPPPKVTAELQPVIAGIESYMFRNEGQEAEKLLTDLAGRRTVRETGLEILRRLGCLRPGQDPQLLLYGVVADFSKTVMEKAEALTPFRVDSALAQRRDFQHWSVFSIDDDSTREVDDALSLRPAEDGSLEMGIHIADPSELVRKGDRIDRAAAERALTLYLATCTVTMLPERIGCHLASLEVGQVRPSLSLLVRIDGAGKLCDFTIERGIVQLQRRLSYEQADAILLAPEPAEDVFPEYALHRLSALAGLFRVSRREQGALIFPRPEIMVSVADDQISVRKTSSESPSRILVEEMMILANRLVAEFALSRNIPIIYRTQPPPREPVEPPRPYDPVLFDRAVRMMRPTRFSTHPQPHSSLALDVYTQITSPLRRFNDLAIHRQLAAHLHEEPAPYTATELIEVMGQAEKVERENKRIEREVTNFWVLEHLRRDCQNRQLAATVVDPAGRLRLAELDDFMVRGILQGAENAPPGSRLQVRVVEVQPQQHRLVLKA